MLADKGDAPYGKCQPLETKSNVLKLLTRTKVRFGTEPFLKKHLNTNSSNQFQMKNIRASHKQKAVQIAALAVFIKDGKVLLEHRRKDEDNFAGIWAIPGGHKKPHETIEQTLKREMHEELDAKILDYKFIKKMKEIDPTSKKPYIQNYFLCRKWIGELKLTAEEELVKWFSFSEALKLKKLRNSDREIIKKLK